MTHTKERLIQQNGASVGRANPGFIAISGPYAVNHPKLEFSKAYKAECVRALREQQAICPKARIVMHGAQAWVIRKKPRILDNGKHQREFASGNLGICAGRMAGRY